MDENNQYNESNNEQFNEQNTTTTATTAQTIEHLPKFKCFHEEHPIWSIILVGLCVLLGAFLATCFMIDKHIKKAFNPYKEMQKMEKVMQKEQKRMEKLAQKEFDRDFNKDFNKGFLFPSKNSDSRIINLTEGENAYVISVDLKNFDNDEDNVKLYVNNGFLTIEGQNEHDDKNSTNVLTISQSYKFPRTVDFNGMTRRVDNGKLLITIPYARPAIVQ